MWIYFQALKRLLYLVFLTDFKVSVSVFVSRPNKTFFLKNKKTTKVLTLKMELKAKILALVPMVKCWHCFLGFYLVSVFDCLDWFV